MLLKARCYGDEMSGPKPAEVTELQRRAMVIGAIARAASGASLPAFMTTAINAMYDALVVSKGSQLLTIVAEVERWSKASADRPFDDALRSLVVALEVYDPRFTVKDPDKVLRAHFSRLPSSKGGTRTVGFDRATAVLVVWSGAFDLGPRRGQSFEEAVDELKKRIREARKKRGQRKRKR